MSLDYVGGNKKENQRELLVRISDENDEGKAMAKGMREREVLYLR